MEDNGIPVTKLCWSFAIVWLLYFLDFVARFAVNPLYPLIQQELALSDARVGLLGSAVLLGMALFVIPLSFLADFWSRTKMVALMALLWSLCSIASGFATSFGHLLAARFGLGVGEASFAPAATALLTSWFRKRRWATVLGIFNTAISLGIFAGSYLAGRLGSDYGWRTVLMVIGVPGMLLGLMALTLPNGALQQRTAPRTGLRMAAAEVTAFLAGNRSLQRLLLFYGISNMGIIALVVWMPMYFVRVMAMPLPQAATLAGGAALLGLVGFPLGGFLSDRLTRLDSRYRLWLPAAVSLVVALLFAIGFYRQSLVCIYLAAFCYNFVNPSLNACSQELAPPQLRSVASGLVIFSMQLIGMLGPYTAGILSESMGLANALTTMQLLFVVSAIGFTLTAGRYPEDCTAASGQDSLTPKPAPP